MIYQYQALDRAGKTVNDFIDAPSDSAAKQRIRQKGLYPVKISKHEVGDNKKVAPSGESKSFLSKTSTQISNFFSNRSSKKEVGIFSRQLSTLLGAGLSLPLAISNIVEQIEHKYFKNIIADVKEKIEEGSSFSSALSRHKKLFSSMYINMVRVGENLGSLDKVIERLADLEEKKNILTSKVRSALWYPLFMFCFAICVVIVLMVKVIPSISSLFIEQKKDLPLPTEIVIAMSNFLQNFWFMIPIVIALGIYIYKRASSTPEGRRKIDDYKLNIPLFKNLYRKMIILRFTQNLGILLNNKVDIIKSFEIVENIVSNIHIEEKISEASKMIKEGASVAFALNKANFLPRLVLGMISAGEASDKLDEMLLNIGRVYETELDLTITGLTSIIEPIIIIFMGLIIGLIVLSVMLPMLEMNMMFQ